MQFRKQGKRIQIFAYRGYDREKRRAKVQFMGSLDSYSLKPSDGLEESLTDDEKNELQSYISSTRQSADKSSRLLGLKYMDSQIDRASDSLSDDEIASQFSEEDAQRLFQAWDKLARVLRRRGHVRRTLTAGSSPAEHQAASSGAERS